MAHVYDPETEGEQRYHPPSMDSLDGIRKTENGGGTGSAGSANANNQAGSTGTSDDSNFKFNRKDGGGMFNPKGLSSAEKAAGALGGSAGTTATFAAGAKNIFWGSSNRKRATIGGGIIGVVVSGGVFMFTFLAGPGQLIQLSQMLQKNFTNIDNASSSRANKLLGTAGAQSVSETRVGVIQRQYLRSALTNLDGLGIEFKTNATDAVTGATIDTQKLAKKYPQLEDMTPGQKKLFIANEFNVVPEQIALQSDGRFSIDARDFPIKSIRLLIGKSVSVLGQGRVIGAINKRVLTKAFDAPSLFHPIKKAQAAATKRLTTRVERKNAVYEEQAKLNEPIEAKANAAEANVKSEANKYNSLAMKTLLFTGGVCFVKSVAGEIITINRDRVVLPAATQATSFIAIGDQIKSGQDISASQVGAVQESLTNDKGQSVWQGKALQVTSGKQNPSGEDIPPDYKQSFSSDTTAATIEGWADDALGGGIVADAACSDIGIGVQFLGGIALSLGSAWGEIASGGTLTPAIAGAWAAKEGVAFAVSGVAMHFIQQFIVSSGTSGKLAKDAFSGPLGGNLLAYGAREAANIGARSEGGIALASSASQALAEQNERQDEQEFKSESFVSRTFDINDNRSLVGKLATSVSPGYSANIASSVGALSNIAGNILSNLSSIFTPRSQAVASYGWGFSEFSIPPDLLDDPELASPPDNADKVAAFLDSGSGGGLIDKSKACFGDDVSKDGGVWDVQHTEDVNPNSKEYLDAHCDDLSDGNWKRMVMFVFDTSTAQAMGCYLGDNQACTTLGFGTGEAGDAVGGAPTGSVSGTAQDLARQILNNPNIQLTGSHDDEDMQNTANGQPAYDNVTLDIGILQFLLDAASQGAITVTSITGGGTHHSPGSNHYTGNAVDIGCVDMGNKVEELNQIAAKYNGSNNGERCDQPNPYGYPPHDHYDFNN